MVFPAYAGVSPLANEASRVTWGLPRLRGGEPQVNDGGFGPLRSSPPTRG